MVSHVNGYSVGAPWYPLVSAKGLLAGLWSSPLPSSTVCPDCRGFALAISVRIGWRVVPARPTPCVAGSPIVNLRGGMLEGGRGQGLKPPSTGRSVPPQGRVETGT